ncbi:MAG: thiamine phosphate synthase [bacterium]
MEYPARWSPASLRLIAITDSLRDGIDGLVARVRLAVDGGATMVQLRLQAEPPRVLVDVARALIAAVPMVPVLVNARADVALAAGAHGVHLGIDDLSPAAARRFLPADMLIGASVGGDDDIARAAGAHFVTIGPVFAPGGRLDATDALGAARFAELARKVALPAVAVGGLTVQNARAMLSARAVGIAVISALLSAPNPLQAARALRDALDASGS